MARPLPVNLLLAGTGTVLLVSGIGGEPIGEVLKGSFGNLKPQTNTANAAFTQMGGSEAVPGPSTGNETAVTSPGGGSSFPPSPGSFRKRVSPQIESREIAHILYDRGITNPTHKQIQEAREFYHSK